MKIAVDLIHAQLSFDFAALVAAFCQVMPFC